MIVGAQGLSLKFSGYECVKWVETIELHRPSPSTHNHSKNKKGKSKSFSKAFDPIAAIPSFLLAKSDNLNISSCQSEDNKEYDFRPRFIKTSQNRYYKMQYFETRNMFTKQKMMIYNCTGFPPGQYSFPFSFKTFEGWPASFNYHTPQKKGVIIYHMTAAIEPVTPQFKLQSTRVITLRQTRLVMSQNRESNAEITSCCCLAKGHTLSKMSFEKDGYSPGQLVQMIIQIDNTNCQANIKNINITVNRTVTLRSQGSSTVDHKNLFTKTINGLLAGSSLIGNNSIKDSFMMPNNPQMKPTCSGKLLSAEYQLKVQIKHDIFCQCCSKTVGAGLPIIIFPIVPVYAMPPAFKNNWAPQIMPQTILILPNNFANFNMSAMNEMCNNTPPPPVGYNAENTQMLMQGHAQEGQEGY